MTNKTFFFLFLLFISIKPCYPKFGYQEGTLYLNNNDSITCLINVYFSDVFVYSETIKYEINNKTLIINSSEVKAIRLGDLLYEKQIIKTKKQVKRGPKTIWVDDYEIFYTALIKDGEVKLYDRYTLQPVGHGAAGVMISSCTCLNTIHYIKVNDQLTKISAFDFKIQCKRIFKNCEDAVNKIKNNKFSYDTIECLVDFVNESCY